MVKRGIEIPLRNISDARQHIPSIYPMLSRRQCYLMAASGQSKAKSRFFFEDVAILGNQLGNTQFCKKQFTRVPN